MTTPLPVAVSYVGRVPSLVKWSMVSFSTDAGESTTRVPLPAGVTTATITWEGKAQLYFRPSGKTQAIVEPAEQRKMVVFTAPEKTYLDVQITDAVQADLDLEVGVQLVTLPLGPSQ